MRKKMLETEYRASRVCRVLGNPTAYQILKILMGKRMTPRDIAIKMRVSETLVSATLRNLRNIDVVRYETRWREKIYWIKDETIPAICNLLEKFVIRTRHKKE